jgi:hypothetical protein
MLVLLCTLCTAQTPRRPMGLRVKQAHYRLAVAVILSTAHVQQAHTKHNNNIAPNHTSLQYSGSISRQSAFVAACSC